MYTLHKIRKIGLKVKLFEAGTDLGEVWHWNRYPGARVDSEIPYYQFSIPEVWKTWDWSVRFPDHAELREYFKHVEKVLGLKKDIFFRSNVISLRFDEASGKWTVKTGNSYTATCKYLIMATGSSYKRHYPDFKGLKDYKGKLLHSADWPAGDVDCTGKRVAIVGSGATGVQLVEQLSKRCNDLTVFLRSPNIALPMRQRKMSPEEQNSYKSIYKTIFKAARASAAGLPYNQPVGSSLDVPDKELQILYEEMWPRGAFNFNIGNYPDFLFDAKANRRLYDFWAKKTRARVTDPIKRDIVALLTPPYAVGTKRSSLEQDYYECINKDHVKLVDLNKAGIQEFRETGIVTADGKLHEFDIIALATGYDSVTGSLTGMGLVDRNGVVMKEKWKDGVYTYLGITCSGFPNMFMVYGPQSMLFPHTRPPPMVAFSTNQSLFSAYCFCQRNHHCRNAGRLDCRCSRKSTATANKDHRGQESR